MKVGRPKKYDESRINISIQLPISILNEITDLAHIKKISRNEFINDIIKNYMGD